MTSYELVSNFLQQEGYKFEETDGLFRFKAQGLNLICEATDRDPMFIRIVAPVIFSMSDSPEVSREQVLSVCNKLVEQLKCLKAYLDRDSDVMLALELFANEDTNDLSSVLERALIVMGQARLTFANELNANAL